VPHRGAIAVLLGPFLVLFTVFLVVPIGYALFKSLQHTSRSGLGLGGPTTTFAGLSNYSKVLGDPEVRAATGRVLLFGIVQVPIMLGLALLMALIFDAGLSLYKRFFQLTAFLPYAIPGIIGALIWSFLYVPGLSPIVDGLKHVGITADFLGPRTVLWSIANISTWSWTGYNMLIIFAALQAIPPELTEAARVDGASQTRINLSIKIPLVRGAIILTAIFSIIGTLQLFSEPMVLSVVANHNVTSQYTPNMAVYYQAFTVHNPEYASAIAVCIAVVSFVLSFLVLRVSQRGRTS
jgi:multiple sugar transport system permease protein